MKHTTAEKRPCRKRHHDTVTVHDLNPPTELGAQRALSEEHSLWRRKVIAIPTSQTSHRDGRNTERDCQFRGTRLGSGKSGVRKYKRDFR